MVISETANGGPMVPPGTYQVKLTVAGKDYSDAARRQSRSSRKSQPGGFR